MAAVGFDSFEYAKELESAGMSRQLAEVVARGMTNSFVLNFDALVTKDYLDARLEQIDARFEQIDARFDQMDARFEHHQDLTDARFAQFSAEFNGKLRSIQVTQAILLAGVAVPVIQSLMVWFN